MFTLIFEQRLPANIPATVPVYAAMPPSSASYVIQTIARAWLGGKPKLTHPLRRVQDWVSAEIGEMRLMCNRLSGAVQFNVQRKGRSALEENVRFPVEMHRVVELAREFLGRSAFIDDKVGNMRLGNITHLREQYASMEYPVSRPAILDAGVMFTRVIDEIDVVGPGGKVMVKVLPDETIAGASRVYRRRGSLVETVRITPAADALAEFERRLRRDRGLNKPVRVLRAQFGYFEAGRSQRQRFFEPVYAFVYTTDGPFPVKSAEVIAASRFAREAWGRDPRKRVS